MKERSSASLLVYLFVLSLSAFQIPTSESLDVHDVAVTKVASRRTVVDNASSISIYVTVENQGNFTETFNVAAYYNQTAIPTPEQWPNLTQTETFRSMGDVNKDGYIEDMDITLIEAVILSRARPGTPCWNPDADLNSDGQVSITELAMAARNLGRDIWSSFGIPSLIINRTAVTLPSGNSTTVTFRWNTTGVEKGRYTISAVADAVPGETDTADNTYNDGDVRVAMIGDITGATLSVPDGKVDIRDIATVARAFGSYPCYPNWNPEADIAGHMKGIPDNKVDIRDIALAAKHFGQIDP